MYEYKHVYVHTNIKENHYQRVPMKTCIFLYDSSYKTKPLIRTKD